MKLKPKANVHMPPGVLGRPRLELTPQPHEGPALLETTSNAEHRALKRGKESQFWTSVYLPETDGILLVDTNWTSQGQIPRVRSLVCPANLIGVDALEEWKDKILSMTFISPPGQDSEPRDAPLPIDALSRAFDEEHNKMELFVRDLKGTWHACTRSVDMTRVGKAELLFDLNEMDGFDEYLAIKASWAARAQTPGPALTAAP